MPASCSTTPACARTTLPRARDPPLPVQYVETWTLKDGTEVTIRPDSSRGRAADGALPSERCRSGACYFRYLHMIGLESAHRPRAADARLLHRLRPRDRAGGRTARRGRTAGHPRRRPPDEADGARTRRSSPFSSPTPVQRQGLGTELLRRLVQIGRDEKLARIVASIDVDNRRHADRQRARRVHRLARSARAADESAARLVT